MKVSIITAVLNCEESIEDCVKSVLGQSYKNIEYIVIDGRSTDGTLGIIKAYEDKISYWISEKDEGIYYAMNKGLQAATGSIVGILNADDIYADSSVINDVVSTMEGKKVDSCYGDIVYVSKTNTSKIVRYWKSSTFSKERFGRGWMPPHSAFFVRKDVYVKYGLFDTTLRIGADYELMLRLLYKHGITTYCIPKVLVKMRVGGSSNKSLLQIVRANLECYKAWRINGLRVNPFVFVLKVASKLLQFQLFHLSTGRGFTHSNTNNK